MKQKKHKEEQIINIRVGLSKYENSKLNKLKFKFEVGSKAEAIKKLIRIINLNKLKGGHKENETSITRDK